MAGIGGIGSIIVGILAVQGDHQLKPGSCGLNPSLLFETASLVV